MDAWPTHPRFEFTARLGEGGMGVVYAAVDRERGVQVAVKTLRDLDPERLHYLKREFRSIADVSHPNVVTLHELVGVGDQWFLVMEHIQGKPLLSWLRADPSSSAPSDATAETLDFGTLEDLATPAPAPPRGDHRGLDLPRLLGALRQLALGVVALHDTGRVHCDLKPSNVLVDPGGRVVILDFGLVLELDSQGVGRAAGIGTASYMAPEQTRAGPVGPEADWYAVGVMLFQALTGTLPYGGTSAAVLARKRSVDAPRASSIVAGVPEELDDLCAALLQRDRARRPTGREVLARLGAVGDARRAVDGPRRRVSGRLVGRDAALDRLIDAWDPRSRRPAVAWIRGASGIGKSTLVSAFLEGLEGTTVLAGRCRERESVPYQAIDEIVDGLAGRLSALGELPPHLEALADLFPTLKRLRGASLVEPITTDAPADTRRTAAFRAFAALLAQFAPAVVVIDDAQWGDLDSIEPVRELLGAPAALLLLVTSRAEEDDAPFLGALRQEIARVQREGGLRCTEIELEVLSPTDTARLAATQRPDASQEELAAIVAASGGHPMFVQELAGGGTAADLDTSLRTRAAELEPGARELLGAVALAGEPLTEGVLCHALGRADLHVDLANLRAAHLLRATRRGVECAHDRVRQAIEAHVPADERQRLHRALAAALGATEAPDPAAMARHLAAAGDVAEARPWAEAAARRALAALAWDQAAHWWGRAHDLATDADDRGELLARRAEALAATGEIEAAARAWLESAAGAPPELGLERKRLAAEHWLSAGQRAEGLRVLDEVLAGAGLTRPPEGLRGLAVVAWQRLRTWWRGTRWSPRVGELTLDERLPIDVCWSVMVGTGMMDPWLAGAFQPIHLRLALDAGDPARIARALFVQATFTALPGDAAARAGAHRLMDEAGALAGGLQDPDLLLARAMNATMVAFCCGDAPSVLTEVGRAEAVPRAGVRQPWPLVRMRMVRLWARVWFGDLRRVAAEAEELTTTARRRKDVYVEATTLTMSLGTPWLCAGQPLALREQIDDVEARFLWPGLTGLALTFGALRATATAYEGDAEAAWRGVAPLAPQLEWSSVRGVAIYHVLVARWIGRCAAAAVEAGTKDRSAAVRDARSAARRFRRLGFVSSEADALVIDARLAWAEGDRDGSVGLLRDAIDRFAAMDSHLQARAHRRLLGQRLGGAEGAVLVAEADAWSSGEGAVDPAALARSVTG